MEEIEISEEVREQMALERKKRSLNRRFGFLLVVSIALAIVLIFEIVYLIIH